MNENNNTTPQPTGDTGKSGNKMWIIIIVIIVIALLSWFMSGGLTRNAAERALEQQGIDVDYDAGGSTTYSSGGDTVTVGGASYPDNWPSDVPKYPNSSIAFSASSNPQTGSAGASVILSTSDNLTDVVAYYKQKLESEGWVIEGTFNAGNTVTLGASKDDRALGVSAVQDGGTTQITVSVEM